MAFSERILDVMDADAGSGCEDADDVESQGIEVRLSDVEVVFGDRAQGMLLAGGDGLKRVSEARPPPQLDLGEAEGIVFADYQVDLSAPCPVVAFHERVTVSHQVAQREVLTPFPGGFQSPTPA